MASEPTPDPNLAQREAASEWLREHWVGIQTCFVCGTSDWQIGDISEIRVFSGGALNLGGSLYPVFPVTCNNCGNTLLINAVIAGLMPRGRSDESDQSDEPVEQPEDEGAQGEAGAGTAPRANRNPGRS